MNRKYRTFHYGIDLLFLIIGFSIFLVVGFFIPFTANTSTIFIVMPLFALLYFKAEYLFPDQLIFTLQKDRFIFRNKVYDFSSIRELQLNRLDLYIYLHDKERPVKVRFFNANSAKFAFDHIGTSIASAN